MAANAAVQALEELESRWRPLRLDGDATAATWLVSAERGFASTLGTQAKWLSCCIRVVRKMCGIEKGWICKVDLWRLRKFQAVFGLLLFSCPASKEMEFQNNMSGAGLQQPQREV